MPRVLAHNVRRYSETKHCRGWRTMCAAAVKRNAAAGGAHCAPLQQNETLLQVAHNVRRYGETKHCRGWRTMCAATAFTARNCQ